jgi:hypothetical protein
LEKLDRKNWKTYGFFLGQHCFNFRHHIGHGSIWIALGPWNLTQITLEELHLFERKDLSKPEFTDPKTMESGSFLLETLGRQFNQVYAEENPSGGNGQGLPPIRGIAGYGSVPMSKSSCKTHILLKETKKFQVWDSRYRWDSKARAWEVAIRHENFETFDSIFVDNFYFFLRKNDYYFVTESGKLYHAPPPVKDEKSRTMTELWTDARRPIVAVIEDADRDRVFLFAKDKTAGAKQDVFFELNPTLRPQPFDHSKLVPVNVEGRARTLLEYMPLIRNEAKK